MNKGPNPWAATIGVALTYLIFVFASRFIGFLHPSLALGDIGRVIRLRSGRQFYYGGAFEETGRAYAEGIRALQTHGHFVAVVLTATAAVLGVLPCSKVDKKYSKLLK